MLETCPRLLDSWTPRAGRQTGGSTDDRVTVSVYWERSGRVRVGGIYRCRGVDCGQSESVCEWVSSVSASFSEVTRTSDIRQIKDEAADRTASGRLARSTHGWVSLFIWNFYIFPQSFPDFSELPKEAMTYYHRSHGKALEQPP